MIANILKRLSGADPTPMTETDARLALAALLVRAARTDGYYAPAEIDRIDRILSARYDLGADAAASLRRQGEATEADAPDTVRFTRAIKDAVPYEHRTKVVEALWQVVLADGERADPENALLRMTASLLGVSDIDSAAARQRVQAANR
ncbi:TerB family tellurite resistance protein [Roseovarius sp. M141]|uniref:tellurite resistance TerB family protein n=1 Tax=Roseovarius sp. M141 TaxID=2583806 RepID=UPI0020CFBAAB|nr:TerB family tellurite resistance protein [Roseovarius sp. M141]MCQ0093629.1 TerB family tellurite resistance protein [Roseovarius sp. M141]